jgi:hypothetical protein
MKTRALKRPTTHHGDKFDGVLSVLIDWKHGVHKISDLFDTAGVSLPPSTALGYVRRVKKLREEGKPITGLAEAQAALAELRLASEARRELALVHEIQRIDGLSKLEILEMRAQAGS